MLIAFLLFFLAEIFTFKKLNPVMYVFHKIKTEKFLSRAGFELLRLDDLSFTNQVTERALVLETALRDENFQFHSF